MRLEETGKTCEKKERTRRKMLKRIKKRRTEEYVKQDKNERKLKENGKTQEKLAKKRDGE